MSLVKNTQFYIRREDFMRKWRAGEVKIEIEPMEAVRHEPLAFMSTPAAKRQRVARRLFCALYPNA